VLRSAKKYVARYVRRASLSGKKKQRKGGVTVTYDEINIGDVLIANPFDKTYRKIQKRAVVL